MGRKSNVGAHNKWGVPIEVLTSVENVPWCVVENHYSTPQLSCVAIAAVRGG
jgi:hypothetical protein